MLLAAAAPAAAQRVLTLPDTLALARKQSRDLQAARPVGAGRDLDRPGAERAFADGSGAGQVHPQLQRGHARHRRLLRRHLRARRRHQGDLGQPDAERRHQPVRADRRLAAGQAGHRSSFRRPSSSTPVLSATVPLIVPSAYPALTSAKKSYRSAEANFAVTEASLLLSAAQAFYAAAGTDELLAARHHAVEVAQEDARRRARALRGRRGQPRRADARAAGAGARRAGGPRGRRRARAELPRAGHAAGVARAVRRRSGHGAGRAQRSRRRPAGRSRRWCCGRR